MLFPPVENAFVRVRVRVRYLQGFAVREGFFFKCTTYFDFKSAVNKFGPEPFQGNNGYMNTSVQFHYVLATTKCVNVSVRLHTDRGKKACFCR